MAMKLYNEADIQAIANAIRTQNGGNDTYTIAQMAAAILALSGSGSGGNGGSLPSGISAFAAGTYTPVSDVASNQTVSISHNLGVIPDLIVFWTDDISWGSSAGAYLLMAAAFPNAPVTSIARKSIYIRGTASSNNSVAFVTTNQISTMPTNTLFEVSGANTIVIKGGCEYKWIALKFAE